MFPFTVQAATDAALVQLLTANSLVVVGEGIQPAPGVLYSHIGNGHLDGVNLAGRYAFLALDEAVFSEAQIATLMLALDAHLYRGPDLRMVLGGSGFRGDDGVPFSVTMRQARLALLGAGLLATVESAINALPEPQKTAAKITWEYSQEVQRNNGLVPQMAASLGMTPEQIDTLFIAAKKL